MALFLSTFVNKIDKKGRVSVPASFRAALSNQSFNGVVTFRSLKSPALEGCGMDRLEALSRQFDELEVFSETYADLVAAVFADAHQLPFDAEGRVGLPESLLSFSGISSRVAFVGCGATFQLWEPQAFASYQADARQRLQSRVNELPISFKTMLPPTPGGAHVPR